MIAITCPFSVRILYQDPFLLN